MSGLRVFIVDDDEAVRDSLQMLLEVEGFATRTFASAESFMEAYRPDWRGCLLLDIRMPGMDGVKLLEVMARRGSDLPVIVMTGHGDVPLAVRAMKAGALEFLEKPIAHDVLLAALRMALDQALRRREVQRNASEATVRVASLTARERDVLERLIMGDANKDIASTLGISLRTVEIDRARLMRKMQASNLSQLVRMALTAGIAN
ncbi:MAG: Transcriptional regulatory protein FixJ [Gammaproteobacteria bacterium]|nr:Transcriptional regulatory protein FixJ [Gammaproteobacteria bacterium]